MVEVIGRYSNPQNKLDLLAKLLISSPVTCPVVGVRSRQVQNRLRSDDIKRLIADYRAGVRVKQLASSYGINKSTVAEHIARAGLPHRYSYLSEEKVSRAIELYIWDCPAKSWLTSSGLVLTPSEENC